MNIRKQYILGILIGLLFGCSPEEVPTPQDNQPVFIASGNLGGNSIDISAGDNNFYMFSEFSKDDLDIFTFTGRFAKLAPDCGNVCNEQLSIHIRSSERTTGTTVDSIEVAIPIGSYKYDGSSIGSMDTTYIYSVDLINKSITDNDSISIWTINSPDSVFTILDRDPEPLKFSKVDFLVELEIISAELFLNCSSYSKMITADGGGTCSAALVVSSDTTNFGDTLVFEIANTTGLTEVLWSDGNTGFSNIANEGQQCVMVTGPNDCMDEVCYELLDPSSFLMGSFCSTAFDYEITEVIDTIEETFGDPIRLSQVSIEYINEDGISYRSDRFPQENVGRFEVLEIMDFDNNENGEKTKKLKVRFTCQLFNEGGEALFFENGEAIIAIAYP